MAGRKGVVDQILELRAKLRGDGGGDRYRRRGRTRSGTADLAGGTEGSQTRLHELQGETPLILPSVDAQAVASVVADWTGIPVGRMVKNEIETVLKLADIINRRIIGQRHALDMIARRIQTSRAALDNPSKPIGVFMLAGPSGVGKTETALALAEALYGGEQNVITINMSEFQEAHTVSTLGVRRRAMSVTARAGADRGGAPPAPTAWCCWTRWKRPITTCMKSSSRCSTRGGWKTAKGGTSISRTP